MTKDEFSVYEYPPLEDGESLPEVQRVVAILQANKIPVEHIEVRGSRAFGLMGGDTDVYVDVPDSLRDLADDLVSELSKEHIDVTVNQSRKIGIPGGTLHGESTHRKIVQQALSQGFSVPDEVIADYPDLGR